MHGLSKSSSQTATRAGAAPSACAASKASESELPSNWKVLPSRSVLSSSASSSTRAASSATRLSSATPAKKTARWGARLSLASGSTGVASLAPFASAETHTLSRGTAPPRAASSRLEYTHRCSAAPSRARIHTTICRTAPAACLAGPSTTHLCVPSPSPAAPCGMPRSKPTHSRHQRPMRECAMPSWNSSMCSGTDEARGSGRGRGGRGEGHGWSSGDGWHHTRCRCAGGEPEGRSYAGGSCAGGVGEVCSSSSDCIRWIRLRRPKR
mmetsp:Transcript_11381/g.28147  ORF Transcript_11381/g.28147 Transcript_11381/m.28147 type:complete len:267 (+) Transcript_11381:394-1194(+)